MDTQRNEQSIPADEESVLVRFLDVAGHDLRNPITVLKSQVQLMQRRFRREPWHDDDLRDLGRMAYQIERLNVSLETYLEAARIAQGRFMLLPEACDLAAIVRRMVNLYDAASRAHSVVFAAPEDSVIANWDPARVELALAVLLSNALKYSPRGDVIVRVTSEPPVVRVAVTDVGIGVVPGDGERIFEQYTGGSNVENPGVGLGLYVARAIVRKHGGEMGVISEQGNGATFWFTLPQAGVQESGAGS
jgi:signal transduction histidine kinase